MAMPEISAEPPAPPEPAKVAAEADYGVIETESVEEDVTSASPKYWVAGLFLLVGLAWVGWLAFTFSGGFSRSIDVAALPGMIATAAAPLVLLMLLWLWIERGSERSVHRHLRLLQSLREEQNGMMDRLARMDTEWLAAQTTLDSRSQAFASGALAASERVSQASEYLDGRLQAAVQAAERFVALGDTASRQMDGLTVALPKVDEVAVRVADQLRDAGRSAYQMGSLLEDRLASLATEAQDAERAIAESEAALNARQGQLLETGDQAKSALDAATRRFGDALQTQRDAALAMLADLATSLESNVSAIETRLHSARREFGEANAAQFAVLDAGMANAQQRAVQLSAQIGSAAAGNEALKTAFVELADVVDTRIAAIERDARARTLAVAELFSTTQSGLDDLRAKAEASDASATELVSRIDAYRAMLEGATDETNRALPATLAALEDHAQKSEATLSRLAPALSANISAADEALSRLKAAEDLVEQQGHSLAAVEQMSEATLSAQMAGVVALKGSIGSLTEQMRLLREEEAPAMLSGVEQSTQSAEAVAHRAKAAILAAASGSAEELKAAIDQAIDSVAGEALQQRMSELGAASERAIAAANAASDHLIHQLADVADRSKAIETRMDEASARAEERTRDNLARHMTLTTETLQSLSVDMTRLLATEVSDQAWDAYLRGDRGIFSRRAVRLLTGSEDRAVLKRYQSDEEFRGIVNRYVQEFESMLRGLVDRRDGNALMVTLLSSDVGKVYVALAQAIERLRS